VLTDTPSAQASATASAQASPAASGGYTPSAAELQALQAFASTTATTGTGQVYMGTLAPIGGGRGASQDLTPQRPGGAKWMSTSDAIAEFGNWTPKQINDLVAKGIVGGLLKPGDGQAEGYGLWQKLVNMSAVYGAKGNQVSPFDVLATYVNDSSSAGVWKKTGDGLFQVNTITGERQYIGPQFRTTTTAVVNLTDPTTAKAVATSIFQQLLGRDPLPGELNTYASALTQAEQANPTTIDTTNQYDSMGNVIATTKQNQQGGYGADAQKFLAAQQAKSNPEFGATQAATTYENAFTNAVYGAHQ
jgi:hypothetical protein